MDELKLHTKFMRDLVSKLVSKAIEKKLGCKIDIRLSSLDVKVASGRAHLSFGAYADMDVDEFKKFTKVIEED